MTAGKKLDPKVAEKVMLKAGLKPLESYKSDRTRWKCVCIKCKEIVYPIYRNVKNGSGCIYCAGRKVNVDLITERMFKANLKPLEPYKSSGTNWKCECITCGDVVSPSWDSIRRGQGGCKRCGYIKSGNRMRGNIDKAFNFMLSKDLEPLEPYKSVNAPWKSKCLKCGHIVAPRIKTIKKGQGACEYCSGTKIDPAEAINFMISKRLKPLEPFKKARSKWKCECLKCGAIVYPLYNTIQQGQGGCAKCGQNATAEKLRYSHDEATEIMLKAGYEPLETYVNSMEKWKCKCFKCGRTVYPTFHNINGGIGGCIFCAEIGFNHNKEAYLYIIFNDELNSIKVGIGNPDSRPDRIKSFIKAGWKLYKKYDFSLGNEAWKIEVFTLRWLRKELKYPQHLTIEQMPKTGGQSETVSADSITVLEIQKKVEELIEGYRSNP
jgi:hypothetical protein